MTEAKKASVFTRCEIRASADGKKLVLRGYPIVFNSKTKVWDWEYGEIEEMIAPDALNELRDKTNFEGVYLVLGHSWHPIDTLGKVGANLRAEIDETGVFFECEMPNTQRARDAYNLVESGIIDGMSFGFSDYEYTFDSEANLRTITKIGKLYEFTITPFPAYKAASVIAKKSQEQKDAEARAAAEAREKAEREAAERAEAERAEAERIAAEEAEKREQLATKIKELEEI